MQTTEMTESQMNEILESLFKEEEEYEYEYDEYECMDEYKPIKTFSPVLTIHGCQSWSVYIDTELLNIYYVYYQQKLHCCGKNLFDAFQCKDVSYIAEYLKP